eukprot:COSAG02_NODE_4035_length_5880_cov_26.342501_6_plen_123_part_00
MNVLLPHVNPNAADMHAPNRGIHATMCSGMTKECLAPRAVISLASAIRITSSFLSLFGTFREDAVLAVSETGQTATDTALLRITPCAGRSSRRDIVPACVTTPRRSQIKQRIILPKRWQKVW